MKKRCALLVSALAIAAFGVTSCSPKEEQSEQSEKPVVPVVDNYTKETTTYSDKAAAPTNMIRFHYHRKGDDGSLVDYIKWSIWVWDSGNGGNGDQPQH